MISFKNEFDRRQSHLDTMYQGLEKLRTIYDKNTTEGTRTADGESSTIEVDSAFLGSDVSSENTLEHQKLLMLESRRNSSP